MKKLITSIFIISSSLIFANETPTISVMGSGVVSGKPDTFSLIASVETSNLISQNAIDENTEIVNNAIKLLKKNGLKDINLKTENYTLNYRTDYNSNNNKIQNEMKYFVRNQITITSNDLKSASKVLTALNSGGVTNIGEINFFISNRKELENEAYKLAYEDAKSKANLIAKIDGFNITPKNIDLSYSMPRAIPFMVNSSFKSDSALPITVPSNLEVNANLNVTFYMQN
ncbi:MAG: SIMPL domain-containing protein [Fusobacteriaceae bacterium]